MKKQPSTSRLNRLTSIQKCLLIAGLASVMGSSLYAGSNWTWTGASDNVFSNTANWSPSGFANADNQEAIITTDSANVVMTAPTHAGIIVAGAGTGAATPVMNITQDVAGNFGWLSAGAIWSNAQGEPTSGNGIINFTSGTYSTVYGNQAAVNVGTYAAGYGTFNFGGSSGSAPVIDPTAGGVSNAYSLLIIGGVGHGTANLTGYGTIVITGSSFYGVHGITIGYDPIWYGGNAGSGQLNITGGNLSITTNALVTNGANSTLSDTIDATGISTIYSSGTGAGSVTIGSGSVFNLTLGTGFSATVGQTFKIMDSACGFTGTFSGLSEGDTISDNGYTFAVTYTGASSFSGGDAFDLTVTAVPEPQTWIMMFSGFAMLMGARRMRRK